MARIPLLAILPPLLFAAIAGLFLGGMFREDPDALPSSQEGQAAPAIAEIPVGALPSFGEAALAEGGPKIVNFWASWCAPCRLEHPYVMALAEDVPVFGVNRDRTPQQAAAFLTELGNPYTGNVADPRNRQSIEWGVYALPETFVLDSNGTVLLHIRGPINEPIYEERIKPILARALSE